MSKKEQDQAVQDKLAAELKPLIGKVDEKGQLKVASGDVFDNNLPEGQTPSTVRELNNYVTNFSTVAHRLTCEAGVEAMAKDKDLKMVQVDISLGCFGDQTSYVQRQHTGHNPNDPTKEVVTKGANRMRIDVKGGDSGYRWSDAKEAIKALAADKL